MYDNLSYIKIFFDFFFFCGMSVASRAYRKGVASVGKIQRGIAKQKAQPACVLRAGAGA